MDDGGHTDFSEYPGNAYLEDDFALSLQTLQDKYDPGTGKRNESGVCWPFLFRKVIRAQKLL